MLNVKIKITTIYICFICIGYVKKEANVILGLLTGSAFYLPFSFLVVSVKRDEPGCNE